MHHVVEYTLWASSERARDRQQQKITFTWRMWKMMVAKHESAEMNVTDTAEHSLNFTLFDATQNDYTSLLCFVLFIFCKFWFSTLFYSHGHEGRWLSNVARWGFSQRRVPTSISSHCQRNQQRQSGKVKTKMYSVAGERQWWLEKLIAQNIMCSHPQPTMTRCTHTSRYINGQWRNK